jgi:hypothetical protein
MSTKFEQLLDFLVNEEMDKANELFHEIVVEKSRSIYENLIAEEEDEEADESREEADESVEEASEENDESVEEGYGEEADESVDLEDSYNMEGDEEPDDGFGSGAESDPTDKFGMEIGTGDHDKEAESEKSEDSAMLDIKNAIQELEAAFAELEQTQGDEEDSMGMDSEFDEPEDEDESPMMGAMESRRMTREYREKVGNDWEKNSQKSQGQYLGANTGESMPSPVEGKSPVSSGKGKPTTGATAKNILGNAGDSTDGQHNTGNTPNKVNKGITPEKSEQFTKCVEKNISSSDKSSMKNGAELSKQGSGWPSNNKTPGPVGSGTGDKAGQTSVGQVKSPINGAPNRNA